MTLQLHNTLSRRKEEFVPLDPKNVRMYVCGPTVYDYIHIGNGRPIVVFDVLFRLLRRLYGEGHVTYARNITDIDDKINARAKEEGIEIGALTERTTAAFHRDIAALGALPPTVEPRATGTVVEMIAMIEVLIARGHAYEAEGHVLFSVPSMVDYGRLSGRDREEQIAGARVDVAPYKADPADFVLWKPSSPELQPGWDSPWGRGRPGWHIECVGHVGPALGGDLRHPRRRGRPGLSPSRERAGPVDLRPRHGLRALSGCTTAMSWSAARRCPSRSATSSRCTSC